jgi:hypothetical protein
LKNVARHQTTALEVAGGEAASTPLILVENNFAIAIEPADGKNLAVKRGYQNRIFEDLAAFVDLSKLSRNWAASSSERQGQTEISCQ